MRVSKTVIPGLLLVEPTVHVDDRGLFMETFQAVRYAEAGIDVVFVQDNCSRSRQDVVRGLHFQWTRLQGKLVQVIRGRIFDVVVDLRVGSPAFCTAFTVVLDEANPRQVYAPPGCAHGFCVLSDVADVTYKCTEYYHPEDEGVLRWNDPQLGIEWPVESPLLSARDASAPLLSDLEKHRLPRFR